MRILTSEVNPTTPPAEDPAFCPTELASLVASYTKRLKEKTYMLNYLKTLYFEIF